MVCQHLANAICTAILYSSRHHPLTVFLSYALTRNFKGLKYRTEWIAYPDIESVCKRVGAGPTTVKPDGVTPWYTVPFIYDPSTHTALSDSSAIASYLDKTYPGTNAILLPSTRGFLAAFKVAVDNTFTLPVYPLIVYDSLLNLDGRSAEYFRRTREEAFGVAVEALAPVGTPETQEKWKAVEKGLTLVGSWYDETRESPFISGSEIHAADIFVAARLMWVKTVMGSESERWARRMTLDGGRWARFLERFAGYETVM